jgi:phosphoserine aminotransferase
VTIVIIRDDLLDRAPKSVPSMLSYAAYAKEGSMQNTPNTFGIYVFMLITRWLEKDIGGLANKAAGFIAAMLSQTSVR